MPLESERVIIQAPMSLVGAWYRTMRYVRGHTGLDLAGRWLLFGSLLLVWWAAIILWYGFFGLLLVPYRLIRRGARKRKLADLRHQEMLSQMAAMRAPDPPTGTDIVQP